MTDSNGDIIVQLISLEKNSYAKNIIKPTTEKLETEAAFSWEGVVGTDGKNHKAIIVPEREQSYHSDMLWAGANEGDLIREGSYRIMITDAKGKYQLQEATIDNAYFNMNRNSAFIIGKKPSIITLIDQTLSSNSNSSRLFIIHNGKIVEVKHENGEPGFIFTGNHIYSTGKDIFTLADYNNAVSEYEVYTYKITDYKTGKTKLINKENVTREDSEEFFKNLK